MPTFSSDMNTLTDSIAVFAAHVRSSLDYSRSLSDQELWLTEQLIAINTALNSSDGALTVPTITSSTTLASAALTASTSMTAPLSSLTAGAAAEAVALRLGASATEGWELRVIDEVVAVTTPAASFDLTQDVPDGAVILSVQGNLDTAITAVTAVKVGIGIAANPDLYGLSSALTLDDKIDLIPDYAVLSGAEDVQVFACDTNGAAAGTIGGAGELVRVRIVFAALNSLDDA